MARELNFSGDFRGQIVEFDLFRAPSGAVAIRLAVALDEWLNTDNRQWEDCRHWNMIAIGAIWVIGKNGRLIDQTIESLCRHAGWDGSFATIDDGTWQPPPVQFDVRRQVYRNQVEYRIGFFQEFGTNPCVDAHELDTQFGNQVRAIARPSTTAGNNQLFPSIPPERDVGKQADESVDGT